MGRESDFTSQALEVNLAETRKNKVELTENDEWFIALSSDYYGIHKRTESFFIELNHAYPDYPWIVNNLRRICIGDFWFYKKHSDSDQAFLIITDCFNKLYAKELAEPLQTSILQTMMQYQGLLLKCKPLPRETLIRIILIVNNLLRETPLLVLRSTKSLKRLELPLASSDSITFKMKDLIKDILQKTVVYWEETTFTSEWITSREYLFNDICLQELENNIGHGYFSILRTQVSQADTWAELITIPMYNDIASNFHGYMTSFGTALEKIYYLYYLLQLPGMVQLKDNILWDINRLIKEAFDSLEEEKRISFIDSFFSLLEELKYDHMVTVLDCIETLGTEIVSSGRESLIQHFTNLLIRFGFVSPGKVQIKDDWQVEVDPNHLKNIRVWLAIIEQNPTAMKELLAALVINLRTGGIFIQDTDLFQKDVTRLLNSDIDGLYKIIKHLTILFPIYYNEIGAEGELRDITTRIDEISGRRDRLIHFLRKQVHAESNNSHAALTEKIIQYWYDGNREPLLPYIPGDVEASLDKNSRWFLSVHTVLKKICALSRLTPNELLMQKETRIEKLLSKVEGADEKDKERVQLIFQLAWLLNEKYSIDTRNIIPILRKTNLASLVNSADTDKLERYLASNRNINALKVLLKIMASLKLIILDDKKSESWEKVYYKRHIAAGIPSMYGHYHEKKFEAMGLTFRLEHTAGMLLEKIISNVNLNYITAKSLNRISEVLQLFSTGLELRGISSQSFDSNIQMLKYSLTSGSFSIDQYINIFQFFTKDIQEIVDQYFISVYDVPLKIILKNKHCGEIPEHEVMKKIARSSETFYRDILASSYLIQTLDGFVSGILRNLRETRDTIPHDMIYQVMSYDPDLLVNPLYQQEVKTDNKVFLGAKAFFLKKLKSFDLPIPEGFILTTELFRHQNIILRHPHMEKELDDIIRREIHILERKTRHHFGDPKNPLLFSVRSGTAFSMPGAMNTFLNVGINREIAVSLSRKTNFAWASWDCYRRLLQSWGMAYGIERDSFDLIMQKTKNQYGVEKKRGFTHAQMMELADKYHELLTERGVEFESDPFRQLKKTILAVLDSWSSARAVAYRKHLQIADEWGTAVLIQRMIFGNLNQSAGTGVLFTKDPYGDKRGINLFGDYIPGSQGEDVVSGLVHTLPIATGQWDAVRTDNSDESLERQFPLIYRQLEKVSSDLLQKHDFPHQEIEFTFESPDSLYILQTRPQAVKKQESRVVFDNSNEKMVPAGKGIGIGGGAINGLAAFELSDLTDLRKRFPDQKCILLRPDTVPDDIEMVFACDGLLTARGGVTSHAAVTAVQLGIVCVVNCRDLIVEEKKKEGKLNGICFHSGDRIAIDGFNGSIYKGNYPLKKSRGMNF